VEDQLPVEHHRQSEANSQNEHPPKPDTHLEGLKLVADPPDLQAWREKLFGVDDNMIVLSEEQ
jgi:glutathione S-transferase